MKRTEFLVRLAIENKLAVVSDDNNVSVVFRGDSSEIVTPRESTSPNSGHDISNEELCTVNKSKSPSEGKDSNVVESEVTSPIVQVPNSIVYGRTCTEASSESSSIITDSETNSNCDFSWDITEKSDAKPKEKNDFTVSDSSQDEIEIEVESENRYFEKILDINTLEFSTNSTDLEMSTASKESNYILNPEDKQLKSSSIRSRKQDIIQINVRHRSPSCEGSSQQRYIKKPSARERPTICPLCYEDVITHFPRHLFRHHKDDEQVKQIKKFKPGSKDRLAMLAALRKRGYFHLKVEKNVLNPTRTSKNPKTDYFVCSYCLGHYTKQLLYKHVKRCKHKPENIADSGRNCLSDSQTFLALETSKNQTFLNSARIKIEVFGIMRADDISMIAKTDPLICLYGEYLLVKHKRQQMAVVISNKIREMARMLKEIRKTDTDIRGFFDLLKPEMFGQLIYAAKVISGYDVNEKSFKAPSLALHMGTNLKQICNVAFKLVLENRNIPNIRWGDRKQKKSEIEDLKKLIEGHWCNELSSLALKTLQEKQWKKPTQLPIAEDILVLQTYLNELAEKAYYKLTEKIDISKNYKVLAECVLSLTVMFNRKRVGEVQYLTIETYSNDGSNVEHEAFSESLTTVEKILNKQFKRIVTGGKGSKPVPILFSKRIQKYIACLMKIRNTSDLVPNTNPYLFANPGSRNKWMAGANIIRRLAKNSGAQKPALLTSTRFRKHIATTLQLMAMQADEIEQIATFIGHTQKTHAEFYRLPQDIYQTAKVAKVLLLLEKGKRKEFKGKSLDDIQLENDVFNDSDSEIDEYDENSQYQGVITSASAEEIVECGSDINKTNIDFEIENDNPENIGNKYVDTRKMEDGKKRTMKEYNKKKHSANSDKFRKKQCNVENMYSADKTSSNNMSNEKKSGRIRWSDEEKKIVLEYFKEHVCKRKTPKKYECNEFLKINGNKMTNKDWVRIKTFVYNVFKQK